METVEKKVIQPDKGGGIRNRLNPANALLLLRRSSDADAKLHTCKDTFKDVE